jgi:hypothetical protein
VVALTVFDSTVLVREWVTNLEYLYGLRAMTLKAHQLLHAVEAVRAFGPWPNIWTFAFEVSSTFGASLVCCS